MSGDADRISQHESETLEAESVDARDHDQRLASELRRGAFDGPTSSAAQLQQLGERPRLPVATERRLVQTAKDGERRGRGGVVGGVLPVIARGARGGRGSPSITPPGVVEGGGGGGVRGAGGAR